MRMLVFPYYSCWNLLEQVLTGSLLGLGCTELGRRSKGKLGTTLPSHGWCKGRSDLQWSHHCSSVYRKMNSTSKIPFPGYGCLSVCLLGGFCVRGHPVLCASLTKVSCHQSGMAGFVCVPPLHGSAKSAWVVFVSSPQTVSGLCDIEADLRDLFDLKPLENGHCLP